MVSKAFIVEDDLDTAALYGHILEFVGFQTEIIRSGEQALMRLCQTCPDIVLLDMKLSHQVSGGTILDFIRREEHLNECQVIVVTGYPNLADDIEKNADVVLIKPIAAKQLSTLVLRLCPNHVGENFLYTASHDPLTGLINYPQLKGRVEHAINRSKRDVGLRFGIILFQVLNLATIKQDIGQQGLNQALLEMVTRIKGLVRDVDTFARLKEDKFAIFLENVQDPANISIITGRLESSMVLPFKVGMHTFRFDFDISVTSDDLEGDLKAFMGL
jgi:PleD family two-component response regulator